MKHLPWSEILDSLERGERPAHLNDCPDCENRWIRARAMLSALAPEGKVPPDSEVLVQRILLKARESRPRWGWIAPRLRWAVVAVLIICLAGFLVLWQHRESDLEQQYVAILVDDLVADSVGVQTLLAGEPFAEWEEWLEDFTSMSFELKASDGAIRVEGG